MDNRIITASALTLYRNDLILREKSTAIIDKYSRDLRLFASYLGETPVSKESVIAFKQHLINSEYAVRSVNSMLASINSFLKFMG